MEPKKPTSSSKISEEVKIDLNKTETSNESQINQEFEGTVKFLIEKGWSKNTCQECGKVFFKKKSIEGEEQICCKVYNNSIPYPFLSYPKLKRLLVPEDVKIRMSDFFGSHGYSLTDPKNIINGEGKTDLIVAGVQMFDGVIHQNRPVVGMKVFAIQPSVRMQYLSKGDFNNGILTSFNNIVTELLDTNIELHLKAIDDWLSAFSSIGFHMDDFILILDTTNNNWGTGDFKSVKLVYVYGGLTLGDTGLLHIPQSNRESIPISDSGFGLERILWATNRSGNYLDALLPITVDGDLEKFDSYRTITLLAICGVVASAKGPGLQLRRLAKVLSGKYYNYESAYLLGYFYDYWSKFIAPKLSKDQVIKVVCLEIYRLINIKICEALKASQPKNGETTEDYSSRLITSNETSVGNLRKIVSNLRKLK